MKLGFRAKLFVVSSGLVLLCLLVADWTIGRAVDIHLTAVVEQDLRVRATLVAREADALGKPLDDLAAWDALADALGASASARVTIIAMDGHVAGDSDVDLASLPKLENHGTRPEVVAARSNGYGVSTRFSDTVRKRLIYVAVPFSQGVARVADPLDSVDSTLAAVHGSAFFASMIAFGFALVLSGALARRMAGAMGELTDVARKMTSGDLDVRARSEGNDEFAALGRALDQLAGSLAHSLGQLRAERDLQASILEGMREGVLVLDPDDRVLLVNAALREMLLLGDVTRKLMVEIVRQAELHEVVRVARASNGPTSGEIDLPGLKPRRLLVHAAALSNDGGLLVVFVDVTDLRRLESLRRDFVANVSHELRTPVTAVRSAAETLRESALGDPTAALRFVDIIDRNAQRLQALIDDLLDLSRLDAKEYRLKPERVDVPGLVQIVLALFRAKTDAKGIKLEAKVAPDVPSLDTDPRALEQVISNLVDNAVKYCPQGASITLDVRGEGEFVRFDVIDTGPGIESKHLARVFERFYRVDAGRSREVGGTGLGLSIVKHLVEAMRGTVGVASTLGRGSTFTVRVPVG